MSRFKILSYCFLGLVLTLNNSCSYEEQENNPNSAITTQLQNELKLDQFTNKNISENTAVNWNNINVFKKDSLEVYEIELVEKNDIKIKSNHFQADLKYDLIAIKQNNVIHSYLIEAFSSAKNKLFSGTIQDLNSYSGTLNIYDLTGKQINQLLIKNGNARNTSNDMSLEPLKNAINMFYKPSKKNLTNRLPDCTMEFRVPIYHDIFKEEYKIVKYDSGELIGVYYTGTKFIGSYKTYTYMSVEYPCDSSADEVHIPYKTIARTDHTFNTLIDFSSLNPCPKDVMSKLMNTQQLNVANILKKLGANLGKYNVVVKTETPIKGTPAATIRTSQFNYKIQISPDYTSATKLFRATNILHELVHAYFISLKDDYSSSNPPNSSVFNDYPTLFQAYVDKKYPGQTDDAHHIEMANQYVNAIATSLQEYNKYADPNTLVPFQVYEDLAWGGLKGTPVYETKFKVGTSERLRVENRYACEQSGHPVGYNTPQLQNTVGKPCN